jgi:hypothetical protein
LPQQELQNVDHRKNYTNRKGNSNKRINWKNQGTGTTAKTSVLMETPLIEGMLTTLGTTATAWMPTTAGTSTTSGTQDVGNSCSIRDINSRKDDGNSRDSRHIGGTPGSSTAVKITAAAGMQEPTETMTTAEAQAIPTARNTNGHSRVNRNSTSNITREATRDVSSSRDTRNAALQASLPIRRPLKTTIISFGQIICVESDNLSSAQRV